MFDVGVPSPPGVLGFPSGGEAAGASGMLGMLLPGLDGGDVRVLILCMDLCIECLSVLPSVKTLH